MKALVTGATGLVGMHIVRALLEDDHEVRALARSTSDLSGIARLPIEIVRGDVLDRDSLVNAAAGCNLVYHAAASFTYWGPGVSELENLALRGTENVLAAAASAKIGRVVVTSSSVVFGHAEKRSIRNERSTMAEETETTPYVISKVRQDELAAKTASEMGIDVVLVCPTVVVGPFAPTLGPSNAVLVTYIADPFRFTYLGGCNVVAADDVGRGHVLAAKFGVAGERYILGGENLEWRTLHEIVAELCGLPGPVATAGHATSYIAAGLAELIARLGGNAPLTTRVQARMLGRYYWYSHAKAARFGFAPRPAREAIATALSWLVASRFVSREQRAGIRLSKRVYAARRELTAAEARLRATS